MERRELVLAALSVANGDVHTPVQLQKLFFLIDREIPHRVNGPHFQFEPYNYGPFDRAVYRELELLELDELVDTVPQASWSAYRLTVSGQRLGNGYFKDLDPEA